MGNQLRDFSRELHAASKNVPPEVYIQPMLSGVSFQRSLVRSRNLEDGAAQTYLLGEKAVKYEPSMDPDTWDSPMGAWAAGFFSLNSRTGLRPPRPDTETNSNGPSYFGSAHSYGVHMAYCDGHVEVVAFEIDPMVHRQTSHRSDGGRPIRIDEPTEVLFPRENED